ncbi:MAG: hypothetical protein LBP29_06640, partial [Treponema sp.]|nr:hypothetical protein [Treponema sp.]
LVIIGLAVFFYGLVPIAGAFYSRRNWRYFRRRFNELGQKPILDSAACMNAEAGSSAGEWKDFRFSGGFESLTGDKILWIRSETLTIPVDLKGAKTYVLPDTAAQGIPEDFDPGEEAPEQIRLDRISALTGGVKVFVGGSLCLREGRRIFASTARPLMVIFYEGPDRSLTVRTIRAGRHRNEFFNFITPYSFVAGAFSEIIMALSLYSRPVYRLALSSAIIALFTPIFPWLPPGIFFTFAYRRLWWKARIFRAYRDLVRLPRAYIPAGEHQGRLPGGEIYVEKQYDTLPEAFYEQKIPFIIPAGEKRKGDTWRLFGVLAGGDEKKPDALPAEPGDAFAVYGALPGAIEPLARRYTRKAYAMEVISWLLLLTGIGINVFFIAAILSLFRIS